MAPVISLLPQFMGSLVACVCPTKGPAVVILCPIDDTSFHGLLKSLQTCKFRLEVL